MMSSYFYILVTVRLLKKWLELNKTEGIAHTPFVLFNFFGMFSLT